MLARTADNLFWLARSMERADYIARTIEATLRLEYLPKTDSEQVGEWEGALNAAGARVSFAEITTDKGHDAFLLDEPELFAIVRGFLEGAAKARGLPSAKS